MIRDLVAQGAKQAEAHDVKGLLEWTTDDFVALPGEHRAPTVRHILRMAFRHYGAMQILYPQLNLDPPQHAAEAIVYFLIVKKDRTYPKLRDLYTRPRQWLETVGENADLYRLQLKLRSAKGQWRVDRAHLTPFQGSDFDP